MGCDRAMRVTRGGVAVGAAVLLGACVSSPTRPPTESATVAAQTPSKSVEALMEMEKLRNELAALRNEVEVQQNEIKRLRERQDDLYSDLDNRLRSVTPAPPSGGYGTSTPTPGYAGAAAPAYGPGSAAGTGVPGAAGPPPGYGNLPPGYGSPPAYGASTEPQSAGAVPTAPPVTDAEPPAGTGSATASQTGTPDTGTANVTAPPVVPESVEQPGAAPGQVAIAAPPGGEQAAYDAAFELLKNSRYAEAIAAFNDVLAQYPQGALADDAQYWIAEAYYVTREFDQALDGFRTVMAQHPDSDRVPDALLKVGYIHYETGDKIRARQTLTEVVTRYPGSRVAISAQTRLQRMEREGG